MKKYYSINELSIMTGLTTRTLRNYIKDNILIGEKITGVWKFTEEDIENFVSNPVVKPSIQAKQKAIISDFLNDNKKQQNQICSILDLCIPETEAENMCNRFCNFINQKKDSHIKFSYEKNGTNIRIILSGDEDCIIEILNYYYRR